MKQLSPADLSRFNWAVAKIVTGTAATDVLSSAIDTNGYEFAAILITTGTMGAETLTISVHSSTTAGGTYALISGATTTLVDADDNLAKWGIVRLEGKNRYIKVVINPSAGTVTSSFHISVLLWGAQDSVVDHAGKANSAAAGSEAYTSLAFNVA